MMGQIEVPDDFDTMDSLAIETLFGLAVEQVPLVHQEPIDKLSVAHGDGEIYSLR